MTVNVTKPALNIREKLAELDKPSGIAGEAMLRADSVQEQRNLIGAGRKNLIINGGMQVSQRGDYTAATSTSQSVYNIDRWRAEFVTVTGTIQDTERRVKYAATSTATGSLGGGQIVELTDNLLYGKTVTVSVKVTSNSPNARIGFLYLGSANAWVGSTAHTGGGAEETLTLTVTLPSTLTTVQVDVRICDPDGVSSVPITSGDYIEFGEVQLELGSVATDFEHRSYGEELALCQRYYWQGKSSNSDGKSYSAGGSYLIADIVSFPVTMRASPTVSAVTNPVFSNCSDQGKNVHVDGFCTRVSVPITGVFSVNGGVYKAEAEL